MSSTSLKDLTNLLVDNPEDPDILFQLAVEYFKLNQYAAASTFYHKCAERTNNPDIEYECILFISFCMQRQGKRNFSVKTLLDKAIALDPYRPEAYFFLAKHLETCSHDNKFLEAYKQCTLGAAFSTNNTSKLIQKTEYKGISHLLFQQAYYAASSGLFEKAKEIFADLYVNYPLEDNIKTAILQNYFQFKNKEDKFKLAKLESGVGSVYRSSLSAYALEHGGSLHPIIVPYDLTKGAAITNASVFVDGNNEVFVNVRETNYILYDNKTLPYQEGPLRYVCKDNDQTLRSANIICKLNDDLSVANAHKVNMKLDIEPNWGFIGLEDARLFQWDDKYYLCGVRRDFRGNGVGRMDLSRIEFADGQVNEIERTSIPAPGTDASYCEKNWMPILDQPYSWVKWTNPTEIVSFNEGKTETVQCDHKKIYPFPRDLKGGSQVIEFDGYYVAVTHESIYSSSDTSRNYLQRIVMWDKQWNIVNYTSDFTMMDGNIEFVAGLAIHNQNVLISFGYQDNAAFVLRIPLKAFKEFLLKG